MKTFKVLLLLAGTTCLLPDLAAGADTPAKPRVPVRIVPYDFALAGDQVLTISHTTLPRHYRVCVDADQDDGTVTVTADGTEHDVATGDCWDFQAKTIAIRPAKALTENVEIHGSYQRIRF